MFKKKKKKEAGKEFSNHPSKSGCLDLVPGLELKGLEALQDLVVHTALLGSKQGDNGDGLSRRQPG